MIGLWTLNRFNILLISEDIMSEQAPVLKWGDIVRIHGVNLSKKDEHKTKGLIVSKGFTDPNIYYQKYDKFEDVKLYRESLFQILPRSNFDMHDQLQQGNIAPNQREQLKMRAISEVTALEANLKANCGNNVKYGNDVIFRHVESQSFLRGILEAADTSEGAFKIQVTEHLSSQIIFKITSHRSYEKDNEIIYYDDALLIYHGGADCFMNFVDKDEPIHLDTDYNLQEIPDSHPFYEYSSARPSIKKPIQNRIPIVNENKSKCLWKFIQHCSFDQFTSKSKIKSHDVVYFKHTKEGGLVSSTLSKPAQYYLKESGKGLYYECFWELIPKQVNELGPEQCNSFWARNLVTGELLTYEDFPVEVKAENSDESSGSSVGFDNEGLINLICSDDKDDKVKKLERGSSIPINQNTAVIVKEFEQKCKKIGFIAVTKLPKDIFMIYKVDDKTLLDVQYALSSHEPFGKFVEIVSSKLLQQELVRDFDYYNFFMGLYSPVSIKESLSNIIVILKMLIGKIYNTNYQDIVSSGNLPDPNMQKILVETGIVQLVIEIINVLYKPFKYMEKNDPKDDRETRGKISEIFEYSYRLLEKVAANNEENRTYISRWVDLFLEHSNHINRSYIQECLVGILQNNPVSIEATINEQKIEQLIESFFSEAKKQTSDTPLTTKYLRLFSTFIVCEDRVIRENQNIILHKFFKNQKNEEQSFRFKVEFKSEVDEEGSDTISKIKTREVLIAFGKQEFFTISKFYRDWRSKWNYFIGYVNLLADICLGRNNEAIKNVTALLSLQIVTTILFDPQMDRLNKEIQEENQKAIEETGEPIFPIANIHEPFVRIAHHLYVNNDFFSPIKRIKKISRWYRNEDAELPAVENINRTKRMFEGEKEEEEEKYLQSILIFLRDFLHNTSQNPSQLSMLYTVLDLLKTTVSLGLWTSIDEFRKLIPDLIMGVTKISSEKYFYADKELMIRKTPLEYVQMNKELLKMNRPETTKSIECKIKATEIFREINQLEIDIRLRYIMNFFKGLYETTEDFQVYDTPIVDKVDATASKLDINRNNQAKEEYCKNDGKSLLGDEVKKMSEDQEIILKENMWYNKLMEVTPFSYNPKSERSKSRYLFQGVTRPEELQGLTEEQISHKMSEHFQHIVLSLMELPIYHDYKLLNSALVMLRSIFEQRKELIDNFKAILICGKGNLLQVYLTLKFMRGKFETLNNLNILKYHGQSDPNFSYAIWKPYDSNQKHQDKRSGIIQDLFFLSRTLKDNISLKNIESLMRVDEAAFVREKVYNYLDEREKNNALFQSVNIAQGIYIPLLKYIQIVGDNDFSDIHFKLLRSIYQYLTLLCFNNLESKQIMIPYIPDVLPHLKKQVGAAAFIYTVCRDNKLLVSNEELVTQIIEASLQACNKMNFKKVLENLMMNQLFDFNGSADKSNYEKSSIYYALRGVLLFHDEGHRRNQELLMNKLQDSKYRRLIFQETFDYRSTKDDFNLSPDESVIAAHFEMFAGLVESGNMINIGKLENIHPYTYCLESLKSTNRWQIRRALRAYVNRLYYVNKDKDVFLFEEFIRKEFDILNQELSDLVVLHQEKIIKPDLVIANGIRFRYALSEIMLSIIEILISLHEIFLKSEFVKVLQRELAKEEKYGDTSRPLHEKLIKLYKNIGCLHKLYPDTKTIKPFIREVTNLLNSVLIKMSSTYLEKKSEPEGFEAEVKGEVDEIGGQTEKRAYVYDHSKSFFRNLTNMIRDLKSKENLKRLKEDYEKNKGEMGEPDGMEESRQFSDPDESKKMRWLRGIYKVPSIKLAPMHIKKNNKPSSYFNPHLQTTNSTTFKVLAKPTITENKQNSELNERLGMVKKMIDESPVFKKFLDDEFILFVKTVTSIDRTSSEFYKQDWEKVKEDPRPVISMEEMLKVTFSLIINKPSIVNDSEKIFILKLVRCYITEAVEGKQDYKLSVDKWDADYCQEGEDESGEPRNELERRQNEIEKCGGSDFIISILSEDLTNRIDLLNEVLLLGIAYLFKGNSNCQKSIFLSLQADKDNLMLLNVRKIIKRIGDFLIDIRAIREGEKKRDFNYNIVDTYDYFSVEDQEIIKHFVHSKVDKFEEQIEESNEMAMCRLFRFLQLFCENNNIEMKKFLYAQINQDEAKKTNSVNFIEEACLLLRKFFKIMNSKIVAVPDFLLAFLGEITQLPCLDNQISIMKSTFFEDISYLACFFEDTQNRERRKFKPHPEDSEDPLHSLLGIYEQGILMALSNFEGNDPVIMSEFLNKCNPRYLWVVMRNSIWKLLSEKYSEEPFYYSESDVDMENCRRTLENFNDTNIIKLINREKAENECFEGEMIMIFNIITIIKKLEDYAESLKSQAEGEPDEETASEIQRVGALKSEFFKCAKEDYPLIGDFFFHVEPLVLQIAVSTFNGHTNTIQNVYFPQHAIFEYLSGKTRDSIMMNVQRDTRRDKLISLTNSRQEIYSEIKWNYRLNYNTIQIGGIKKDFPITSGECENIRTLARNLSLFICALLLVFITVDHDEDTIESNFFIYNSLINIGIRLLCFVQLLLTLWYCYLWGKMRGKLALVAYKKQEEEDLGIEIPQLEEAEVVKSKEGWITLEEGFRSYWNGLVNFMGRLKSLLTNSFIYTSCIEPIIAIQQKEEGFLSLALFLIASILGNFYRVEWFTVHIFDFFVSIPILSNVFTAILNNIKILTILSLLATAFILVFNVLSFSTYSSVIYEDDIPEQACETILDCILELYTSGAIGDDMDTLVFGRFIFDIVYVVFMELLFQSLVGGIMIDAFSELSESYDSREEDKQGFCYICSMSRPNIEKTGVTFNNHIKKHWIWNYAFYIYCLENKDATDYTGIEYVIINQLQSEEVMWFPDLGEGSSDGQTEELMGSLTEKVTEMKNRTESILKKGKSALEEGSRHLKPRE